MMWLLRQGEIGKMGAIFLGVVAGLLILLEVGLRVGLGLGKRPLYLADPEIGYLLAPNQRLHRLGNWLEINQYSLRNGPIQTQRADGTLRVLLLGDSIANGGWWTDQQQTISALMERQLPSPTFPQVEVLNASANSWGPRNQVAYLRRYGPFESQVVALLLNTDDLFATAPTSLPVGRDPNYPTCQPPLALAELFARFFTRPQPIPGLAEVLAEKGDRVGFNLTAIAQIQQLALQSGAQFLLAMTPLRREVDGTPLREYEREARKRLQAFAEREGILYLDFLPLFQQVQQPTSLYRDHIHLSPQGNHLVSQNLSQPLFIASLNEL